MRNQAVIKALRHNQASTSLLPRLILPALPGTGSRAGDSTQAGRWHCADLLAGLAAHLGQSCDMVRCRCVFRCFPFSLFTIHL